MRRIVFLALLALAAQLPATDTSAQTAADKAMAQRIGSVLKESGQLRDYRVAVKFQNGVAWLNGEVTDGEQAAAATSLAREIPGVTQVVSELEYPGASHTPRGNSGAVRNAFDNVNPARGDLGTSGVMQAYADVNVSKPMPAAATQPMANYSARPTNQRPGMQRMAQNANRPRQSSRGNMPRPMAQVGNSRPPVRQASAQGVYQAGGACPPGAGGMAGGAGMAGGMGAGMGPVPAGFIAHGSARGPSYENAQMPGYAWPSYASYPNYAALTYPQQYSPTAWPYIGPFYPYPQVPLAWRKVSLEWDDGWWFLDFSAHNSSH